MAKKQQWAQDREASRICQNPFPRLFWTNLVSALRQKCSYYLLSSHKGTQPAPMSQCSGSICRNNRIVSSLQQQQQRLTKRFDFCQFHGHRAPRAWIIRQNLCRLCAKIMQSWFQSNQSNTAQTRLEDLKLRLDLSPGHILKWEKA